MAEDNNIDDHMRHQIGILEDMHQSNAARDHERPSMTEDAALAILTQFVRPGRAYAESDVEISFQYAQEFVAEVNRRRVARGQFPCDDHRFAPGDIAVQA